jgi:hypothetical protein
MDKDFIPIIRELYPHFNDKELAEAEDNLDRYLLLVLRIFERIESKLAQSGSLDLLLLKSHRGILKEHDKAKEEKT